MWIECEDKKIVNADRLTHITYYASAERTSTYYRPCGTFGRAFGKDDIFLTEHNAIEEIETALANGVITLDLTEKKKEN